MKNALSRVMSKRMKEATKKAIALLLALVFAVTLNIPVTAQDQNDPTPGHYEPSTETPHNPNQPTLIFDSDGELLNPELLNYLLGEMEDVEAEEEFIGWIECPIMIAEQEQEPAPEVYIGWTHDNELEYIPFESFDADHVVEYYFGWPEDFCFYALLEYYLAQEEYIGWVYDTEAHAFDILLDDEDEIVTYYFGWPEGFCPYEYIAQYTCDGQTDIYACWETSPYRHELDMPTPRNAATLTLSASSWSPSYNASTMIVNVNSNTTWRVARNGTWIGMTSISPSNTTGNGRFTITVTANTGTTSRTGSITVTATGAPTRTINITQAANVPTLIISQHVWNPSHAVNQATINVTSNRTWNATSNATSWLTISNFVPTNRTGIGSFRINTTSNTGLAARTGTITVTAPGATTRTINVTQAAPIVLTVSPSGTWNSPSAGGNTTITVTSNVVWNNPISSHSWLTISNITPTNRNGSGSFRLNTTANTGVYTRTATVTISAPGAPTRTIQVSQGAQPGVLTISQNTWNITNAGSAGTFNVVSNRTWQMQSSVGWLTFGSIQPPNSTGNGSFRVNASANTGTTTRTGTVTVSIPGISRHITVTQTPAPTLTVTPGTWNPVSGGNFTTVNVTSNITWNIPTSNQPWLTISQVTPTNRTGSGSFRMTATANPGPNTRTATVTVSGSGITRSIPISQQPPPPVLTLSLTGTWHASSSGDGTPIGVTSNITWNVSSNFYWISITNVTPVNRTGNGSFRINATANHNEFTRTATVTVTGGGITRQLHVSQAPIPANLTISHGTWPPTAAGGSQQVQVWSNRSWTASSNATSWLTVSPASGSHNGSFLMFANANARAARSGIITVSGGGITRQVAVTQAAAAFTVNFNLNGGTGNAPPLPRTYGTTVGTLPANPTRAGHGFAGWYTAQTGGTRITTATPITNNVTFWARWTAFNVTFNSNGGTAINPATRPATAANGTVNQWPNNPTRAGHTFAGWFTAQTGGTQVFATTPITNNMTVWARWTPLTFTVNFNLNGGTGNAPPLTRTYGATVGTLPANPTRAGHGFAGWYTAQTGGTQVLAGTDVTSNMTVWARWTAFNVTFNSNGGTAITPATRAVAADGIVRPWPTPTRAGYEFVGWFTAQTGGTLVPASTIPANNMTAWARWAPLMHTVNFDLGGFGINPTPRPVAHGDAVGPLPVIPNRDGFAPDGWITTAGRQIDENERITNNVIFTARWRPIYHRVTFDLNGATGSIPPPRYVRHGTHVGPAPTPEPTRTSHSFDGWSTLNQIQLTDNPTVTGNMTFLARWTANTYTITFNANGGIGGPPPQNRTFNTVIIVPAESTNPTRQGYTFTGWFANPTGGYQLTTRTLSTAYHTQWWAGWAPRSYWVTFDPNGGSPTPLPIHRRYNAFVSELPMNLTRDGYTHIGWSTQRNGGEVVNEFRRITGTTTFYARWQANRYATVTLYPSGGRVNPESIQVAIGDVVSFLPTPQKTGYTFNGWFVVGGRPNEQLFVGDRVWGDMDVYARWVLQDLYITFDPMGGVQVFPERLPLVQGAPVGPLPPAPTRRGPTLGHHFVGWYTHPTSGWQILASDIVGDRSISAYARWECNVVRWPTRLAPGRIWYHSSNVSLQSFNLSMVPQAERGIWQNAMESGMNNWTNSAAPVRFYFRAAHEAPSRNVVEMHNLTNRGENFLGLYTSNSRTSGVVNSFTIQLCPVNIQSFADRHLIDIDILITMVMAHELGHALGLRDGQQGDGHPTILGGHASASIMNSRAAFYNVTEPTYFDINSVRLVYD